MRCFADRVCAGLPPFVVALVRLAAGGCFDRTGAPAGITLRLDDIDAAAAARARMSESAREGGAAVAAVVADFEAATFRFLEGRSSPSNSSSSEEETAKSSSDADEAESSDWWRRL